MSNSIINSKESEDLWFDQIWKTLHLENFINIDDPPSIFRVSKSLSDSNPEAYFPHQIGLGPYHHLRPELYISQWHKLSAIKKFLTPDQFKTFPQTLISRFLEIEPIIRSCYKEYLNLSGQTLALILAIDGLYLLQFLTTFRSRGVSYWRFPQLGKDLIMLENQIPGALLQVIRNSEEDPELVSVFLHFNRAHSPLKLTEQKKFLNRTYIKHLLGFMYHLIVNNRGIIDDEIRTNKHKRDELDGFVASVVNLAAEQIEGVATVQKIVNLVQSSGVFKKTEQKEKNVEIEEVIEIPSVTQLRKIIKLQFKITPGGIRY